MILAELYFGIFRVYDFGGVKLRAYQSRESGNPLREACAILEKGAEDLVFVEAVSCLRNIFDVRKSMAYMKKRKIAGVISGRRRVCREFLEEQNPRKVYCTPETAERFLRPELWKEEEEILSRTESGKNFDRRIFEITNLMKGKIKIGGLDFVATRQDERGFDVEIPEINCGTVRELGADRHSTVFGERDANSLIEALEYCLDRKYKLILTPTHVPEDLNAARSKILYLERLKKLAKQSSSAENFIEKTKAEYPDLLGERSLAVTAKSFFPYMPPMFGRDGFRLKQVKI